MLYWQGAICGVCCAGTATTTAVIPQHEMDIQALNDSNPDNGGGKIKEIANFSRTFNASSSSATILRNQSFAFFFSPELA